LRKTKLIRPEYAEKFRCIGPTCEDSCCVGWRVDIDQATYEKYQTIPAGPLRTLIDASIVRTPEGAEGSKPGAFSQVKMGPSLQCPFQTAERLCRIQVEYGAEYLSRVCANFPRTAYTIDNLEEKTLTLSCPEAARLVLLNPELLKPNGNGGYQLTWDDAAKGETDLRVYFWPIREFAIGLVRNRAYPLWQRLFLLGTFCRRLDAIARSEQERGFPAFVRDFSAAVACGSLRNSMDKIPADLALQLDMLLRLVKLRAAKPEQDLRMGEKFREFCLGIGLGAESTMENHIARYASAYQRYYAPFFEAHPYILENYLANMIFRGMFPYGPQLLESGGVVDAAKAFAALVTNMALIKGLLIGVAGCHKEAFSTEHVVRTVQTVFKIFEHHPEFLAQSQELLASRKLDNAHGLTMLLRN
jgi:lysine-N-methylase